MLDHYPKGGRARQVEAVYPEGKVMQLHLRIGDQGARRRRPTEWSRRRKV